MAAGFSEMMTRSSLSSSDSVSESFPPKKPRLAEAAAAGAAGAGAGGGEAGRKRGVAMAEGAVALYVESR